MKGLKRAAIILQLVERLRSQGSWCGETHIQKSVYFLQSLMEVPLEFEFILYKHDPFSFDLGEEITAMIADMILSRQPQPPYGPSIVPGEGSQALKERFPNTIASCSAQIDFIAKELGGRNVVELECLAAALYVTLKAGETESPASRAPMLRRLKPHVSERKAEEAIAEVDSIAQRARSLRSEVGQPSG